MKRENREMEIDRGRKQGIYKENGESMRKRNGNSMSWEEL